ncbi:MAG: copper chaperone PCu(A)C [Acidimicrobiia bacterium]
MSRRVAALAAALLLGTCGGGEDAPAATAVRDHGLVVRDAWMRPTPPGSADAAVYLEIESVDAPLDGLLGGRSDRCLGVIAHRSTIRDDGVAVMTSAGPDDLRLRPGDTLSFGPNGLHLMCTGVDGPIAAGERVEVELYFEHREPLGITVAVEQR